MHFELDWLQKYYLCRKFNYVEILIRRSQSNDFNGIIVYGDPICHHHCEGHHHE